MANLGTSSSITRRVWTVCAVLVASCLLIAGLGVTASARMAGAQGRTLAAASLLLERVEQGPARAARPTAELRAALVEDRAVVARWSAAWTAALILGLAASLASAAWVTHTLLRDVVRPIRGLTGALRMLGDGELHAAIEGV